MKISSLACLSLVALLAWVWSGPARAAEVSKTDDPEADLAALVDQVREKLTADKSTAEDLAPELKAFDELLEHHKENKTEAVAQIRFMQAMLYLEVLKDAEQAKTLITRLKKDFPETEQGKSADNILEAIENQRAALEMQKKLAVGAKFPDFEVKDTEGKPLSIARFKGKVVLIDFWATWCGPCIRELPNVLETYEKHHDKGFEIIGISLDKEEDALSKFVENRKMTWPQFFDGKGWQNELAQKYGVQSIPATFLLDGQGVILAKNLRGTALETAVADALQSKP